MAWIWVAEVDWMRIVMPWGFTELTTTSTSKGLMLEEEGTELTSKPLRKVRALVRVTCWSFIGKNATISLPLVQEDKVEVSIW